jgi:hypothetical protein
MSSQHVTEKIDAVIEFRHRSGQKVIFNEKCKLVGFLVSFKTFGLKRTQEQTSGFLSSIGRFCTYISTFYNRFFMVYDFELVSRVQI